MHLAQARKEQLPMRILRLGEFTVTAAEGATQCGFVGQKDFTYRVEIYANSAALDARGFLIDNNEIDRYFQRKFGTGSLASCELMACQAVRDFRRRFERRGQQVDRIVVEVAGSHLAGLQAEWSRG